MVSLKQLLALDNASDKPLKIPEVDQLLNELDDWQITDSIPPTITRKITLEDYDAICQLVDQICLIAKHENHHPTVTFTWQTCLIEFTTHSSNALSAKDFVCAAKIDSINFGES